MTPEEITSELRDIKPPVEIPSPDGPSPLAIAAVVLLGVLLCAFLIWWLVRRFRQPKAVSDPVAVALADLESIRHNSAQAPSDEYAVAISTALRRYLESHLATPAERQTSEEFLSSLADNPSGPLLTCRERLQEFLRQCDLVKFAREDLPTREREKLHDQARSIVEATSRPTLPEQSASPSSAAPLAT